jgi:hypothetical protein
MVKAKRRKEGKGKEGGGGGGYYILRLCRMGQGEWNGAVCVWKSKARKRKVSTRTDNQTEI